MKFKLRVTMLVVAAAMLFGAALRLDHLAERSMTHPEMYVPGIPLRADLSVPKPRMDLPTVITNTLSADTHPPAYYVLMWFVTKFFGSGTMAIRLPSVIFGIASIGFVFWLGMLIGQRVPGALAAALLAFHGYHILWSKTGRMYTMLCFLGLLTTILLLKSARSTRPRRDLEIAYVSLTLLALSTDYFFWPFFATQMIWVTVNAWIQGRRFMPRLLQIQMLVAILGSPLLAFAAYQSDNNIGRPSGNVLLIAREYLQFLYLIPGWDDTPVRNGTAGLVLPGQFPLLRVVLFLFCALLLVLGIRRLRAIDEELVSQPAKSFKWLWLLAAAGAVIVILTHIFIAQHHGDARPTLKYTEMMTILPLFMAMAAILFEKSWRRLRNRCARLPLQFLSGGPPLVWLLAVAPFVMLATASVLFRPLIFPRGLLFLFPCLLLTLASGIVVLGQRSAWRAACLVLILGFLHGLSVAAYRNEIQSPVDFKEFADKLKPHVRSDDLVFLSRNWAVTPILYYLKPDQYHLRADHFAEVIRQNPGARVWVLEVRTENPPEGANDALEEYHEVGRVQVYLARAVLYCKKGMTAFNP